jgi:hypothetical protein
MTESDTSDQNTVQRRIVREKKPNKMTLLARHWDALVSRARQAGWIQTEIKMTTLAQRVGLEWHSTYSHDLLSKYLALDGAGLTGLRDVGPVIINSVILIVERALKEVTVKGNRILEREIMSEVIDPRQTLAEWRVPLDLPCRFMNLPERIQSKCREEWEVRDLGDLLDFLDTEGFSFLARCRNLGSKSVAELEQFVIALKYKDPAAVSKVLPLADSGNGLSLGNALRGHLHRMIPSHRRVLELCLGECIGPRACADKVGLTPSFVGVVRMNFLGFVGDWLRWFDFHDEEEALAAVRPHDGSLESDLIAQALLLALAKRLNNPNQKLAGRRPRYREFRPSVFQ